MAQKSTNSPGAVQQAATEGINSSSSINFYNQRPSSGPFSLRTLIVVASAALVFGGVFLANKYQTCKQQFTSRDDAQSILNACNIILKFHAHDKQALIARAQAQAVLGLYDEADDDFRKVFALTPQLDRKDPSKFTSEERQIAFLQAFWPEFRSLVEEESGVCMAAKNTYNRPIAAYRSLFTAGYEETGITRNELLKILELAHFASDRDGEWNLASELYGLILRVDPDNINALLGKAHAHLMSGEDLETAKAFLDKIDSQYPRQRDIQAKIQYHRGSIYARQGEYIEAVRQYREILENPDLQGVLNQYPLLNYIVTRDKAFSLYAASDFSEASEAFSQALFILEEAEDIGNKEKSDRKVRILEFRERANLCNESLTGECGLADRSFSNLVEYGLIFSHLVAHETEQTEHAFFEEDHEKFYGCMQTSVPKPPWFSATLTPSMMALAR